MIIQNMDIPAQTIYFDNDLYQLQHLPNTKKIVLNNFYNGLIIVNIFQNNNTFIEFPALFRKSGIISNWCFSKDSSSVVLFDDEAKRACLICIEQPMNSYDFVNFPNWSTTHDLRYIWEKNELWLLASKSYQVFSVIGVDTTTPKFEPVNTIALRRFNQNWAKVQGELSLLEYNILRIHPDQHQFIYHHYKTDIPTIGVKNWDNNSQWAIPFDKPFSRLTASNNYLFVMQEYYIFTYNPQGELIKTYMAPEGFSYVGLDIIPVIDNNLSVLVIGCQSQNSSKSQLFIYNLS